ncbi:hypothetical protein PAECIP111893_04319 [Paenibacillus plantiphilus]|uniref:Uncharacterized protein n=1 Tax=Paenibacillus plantiphilus TaxID=2905650 RepID=A0ABM9CML9_9BACL|nr:hypothetical protein [Paenibacillus plantiphilus]CAH1217849.1 hypothetical protein PAECIP111893_04319 [Paenibacillus plantiphilus]
MSAKVKFNNVKVVRKNRARISSSSSGSSSGCGKKRDRAVDGMQEAGEDLCDFFCSLKHRQVAAKLVRAIRCKNRKVVEHLIGHNCNVVNFFNQGRFSCVRISCVFGECCDVRITFDICVSNEFCGNDIGGRSDRTRGNRCCGI